VSAPVTGAFPRRADALGPVLALAEAFLATIAVPEATRFLVVFALEELFTNTVKYNPAGADPIGILMEVAEGELHVAVTDPDADRFDPNTDAPVVDPDLPLEARTPGGLGIHLLKRLSDRVAYDWRDRRSTTHIYKRLE